MTLPATPPTALTPVETMPSPLLLVPPSPLADPLSPDPLSVGLGVPPPVFGVGVGVFVALRPGPVVGAGVSSDAVAALVEAAGVVVGSTVLALDTRGGRLVASDARTGATTFRLDLGPVTRFATPAVSQDVAYIGTQRGLAVVALN